MAISKKNQFETGPEDGNPPAPLIAITSVVLSMALIAVGNGLMFAYIPVRLGAGGFDPTWAGLIITGLSAGGLAGCILTGPLVRRVGHARAFMVLSALIALSNAAIGAGTYPLLWIAARALYGFAICGLFIVAQSWLNDAVANSIRGRVMAVFYVAYVAGLGVGYATLAAVDIATAEAPLIGIAFTALSLLPVGLTRLPTRPRHGRVGAARPGGSRRSASPACWLSAPVDGDRTAPIHATASATAGRRGLAPGGDADRLIPWFHRLISDRTDRRYVPIAAAASRWRRACLPSVSIRRAGGAGGDLHVTALESIARWPGACRRSRQQERWWRCRVRFVCPAAAGLSCRARDRFRLLWDTGLHLCGDRHSVGLPPVVLCGGDDAWCRRNRQLRAMSAQAPLPVELAFAPDQQRDSRGRLAIAGCWRVPAAARPAAAREPKALRHRRPA